MNNMDNETILSFNEGVIEEFRANEGQCGGNFEGNPMILLTMTGAKSGRELVSPLTYHALSSDDIVIMASAGGHPKHPAWYFNITANPDVVIELGAERYEATAAELEGDERTAAYESMIAAMPRFADYQAAVDREIPVMRLRRTT